MSTFTATTTKRLDNVVEMLKEHLSETQAFALQIVTMLHSQTHIANTLNAYIARNLNLFIIFESQVDNMLMAFEILAGRNLPSNFLPPQLI